MGLEGNMWKGKSIDGDWLKKHEVDEISLDDDNKDSYDYLFNKDELLHEQDLIDEEEDRKNIRQEMADFIEESVPLWSKDDLGKYTINTPIADKQQESMSSRGMEVFDEKEFQKALDEFNRRVNDGDPIKEETNAEMDSIIKQMELDW